MKLNQCRVKKDVNQKKKISKNRKSFIEKNKVLKYFSPLQIHNFAVNFKIVILRLKNIKNYLLLLISIQLPIKQFFQII